MNSKWGYAAKIGIYYENLGGAYVFSLDLALRGT